ncbi:Acyl-CoA N-acyltransferase [Penicillium lagena]|uniref:Acyl-CoA N-acyltransferase n=1 Tax=Penicillium lagena TaxID=94218 RepID=UPI00253FA81A|nr:Acyl-CoA N-acyltransferase [Penicillium lagena]KAJ5610693.1 Acyl-CoA N-acyltransferase [Penicillium lagena]
MSSKSQVTLVPWDPKSTTHLQRLVEQRLQCTWDHEKVATSWRESQIKGNKCLYWIEAEMLQDTAAYINGVARDASKRNFVPVGHIALDEGNPDAKDIELDLPSEGVFWIKTFFVTHALQSKGIGRAALDEVETMAVKEPLQARILMLDTVQKDDQRRKEFADLVYGGMPKVTNQEWYARRGYRLAKTVQNYYQVPDKTGKIWDTKTVFMRKDIA